MEGHLKLRLQTLKLKDFLFKLLKGIHCTLHGEELKREALDLILHIYLDKKMSANLLSVTAQKQPVGLVLDFTNVGKQHLNWLLPRLALFVLLF